MTIIKRKTFIIKHFARFAEQTDLQKKQAFGLVRVFSPSFPSYLCGFIIILIHYVFSIRIF